MQDEENAAKELLARAYALQDPHAARELYRDWARTYDDTMLRGLGYLTPTRTAELLCDFLPDKQALVLDVGSGTGLAGRELAKLGYSNLDALDFSPQMLEVAASRNIYRQTIEADLNGRLAIADASYDALISTGIFTHGHVGPNCLDELFRVLRPGGVFACTIHKDVFETAGFRAKIAAMGRAGVLSGLYSQAGAYYASSLEPDGFYIVWRGEAA